MFPLNKALFLAVLTLLIPAACCISQTFTPTPSPLPPPTSSPMPVEVIPTATPVPTPVPLSLYELHMIDPQTGWGWSQHQDGFPMLLHTRDGGRTWKDVSPSALPGISGGYFLDGRTAWLQTFDAKAMTAGLGMTVDAGATWTQVTTSIRFFNAQLHFTDAQNGWAVNYNVGAGQATVDIYATKDGGATWDTLMLTDPDLQDNSSGRLHLCSICGDSLYYDPKRLIIVYGDMANEPAGSLRLAVSTDLGQTWKKISVPFPLPTLAAKGLVEPGTPHFFDARTALLPVDIVTSSADGSTTERALAVYSTSDGGLTWTSGSAVLEGLRNASYVDFVSSKDGFAACGSALCITHDGGRTWKPQPESLSFAETQTGEFVWHFSFVDASTGWAITTDENNHYGLYTTSDAGQTWTKLSPGLVP